MISQSKLPNSFSSAKCSFASSNRSPNSYSLLRILSNTTLHPRLRSASCYSLKLPASVVCRHGIHHRICQVRAMDEGFSSFGDWGDDRLVDYMIASSDGEESDGEVMLNPLSDIDLPTSRERFRSNNDSITMAAHRFGMLRFSHRQNRIKYGVINNIILVTFSTMLLLFVDWCAWRIVRLPLEPFYLMRPFCISAIIVACTGYVCVPLFRVLKIHSVIRRRPARHFTKKGTPTMGGLFFIPIGIIVAEILVGFSSIEVSAAAAVTVAFAAIGLLNDMLSLAKIRDNGLSTWIRVLSEVAVGSLFSLWLDATKISSPYSMKMLVPLPGTMGLVFLGKHYLFLSSFCFVSMANGIDLTDGLDGLAGGTAALAFIGMSIAVLPICPELAVFGASMAGACIGFLSHNRYKASVFMGDTGSLALGGALAAMASCTGMFFPLLISSGFFVLETTSVIMQVFFFKATKYLRGYGRRLFKMAPFHHHLELYGVKEPYIVAGAYVISSIFTLLAGYVGLVSA